MPYNLGRTTEERAFHKKGTMHFEFLDENIWFKFNYEVSKLKGWELPKKKAA